MRRCSSAIFSMHRLILSDRVGMMGPMRTGLAFAHQSGKIGFENLLRLLERAEQICRSRADIGPCCEASLSLQNAATLVHMTSRHGDLVIQVRHAAMIAARAIRSQFEFIKWP